MKYIWVQTKLCWHASAKMSGSYRRSSSPSSLKNRIVLLSNHWIKLYFMHSSNCYILDGKRYIFYFWKLDSPPCNSQWFGLPTDLNWSNWPLLACCFIVFYCHIFKYSKENSAAPLRKSLMKCFSDQTQTFKCVMSPLVHTEHFVSRGRIRFNGTRLSQREKRRTSHNQNNPNKSSEQTPKYLLLKSHTETKKAPARFLPVVF